MNNKRIISLVAPLLIATAAAAPAQAVVGGPVSTLKKRTFTEGINTIVTAKGNCPTFEFCDYRLYADSGTAQEGTDFTTGPDVSKRLQRTSKQRPMKLRIFPVADNTCEQPETIQVRLESIDAGDDDYSVHEVYMTLNDVDCATQQPAPAQPAPAQPAPAQPAPTQPAPQPQAPTTTTPPADSGSPEVTTQTTSYGVVKSCRTPFWTGKKDVPNGGQGYFYNSGCTVSVTCPASVRVCKASGEGANNSENYRGEKVTLNSRLRAFSASNTQFWFRDQSCAGTDWCRTEDTINIRGGETITNQCNGLRETVAQANRTAVRCTITLETLY